MKSVRLFLLALLAAAMFSCKPDDPYIPAQYSVGHGVFVLNEGDYQGGHATLTFYDPEADTVINSLFKRVNFDLVQTLGDVAQSMAIIDGKLYIVVNNSNLIYKMDANTIRIDTTKPFKLLDFYSPREMHVVAPNKAYVSDLIGTNLWIINPQDMTHTGTVEMGKTTEKMVQVGNELYVSNWSYYYVDANSHDSYTTVQVVDLNNDVKVAEIQVGKEPNCMAVDKNGHVWVLCEGRAWDEDYGESPSLWEIDPMLKTAQCRVTFESVVDTITATVTNYASTCMKSDPTGRYLYVVVSEMAYGMSSNSEIRRFDVDALTFSDSFSIASNENSYFYNMAVAPQTGEIYVSCISDGTMPGTVYRYTSDGVLLSSFAAGLFPSAMLFK